jgi:monofunctional biosynthetic peptidoglycan transglycosylase
MPRDAPRGPAEKRTGGGTLLRALRWALRGLLLLFGISVLQVILLRWIDPLFTLTMVEASLQAHARTDRWSVPQRRRLPAGATEAAVARMIVSSEDGRFFLHHGFEWRAICAAVQHNRRPGAKLRGASTISQQVARNVFLWQRRSLARKLAEAYYTVLLELLVPKQRILEVYLQVAQTGPVGFGVEWGAQHHFQKSALDLNEDEAARLASLLPAPARRGVRGEEADRRAARVRAHRAPLPTDPGFEALRTADAGRPPAWRACLRGGR